MRYFSEMRNSKLYEGIPYLGVNIRTYIKVFPGDIFLFGKGKTEYYSNGVQV